MVKHILIILFSILAITSCSAGDNPGGEESVDNSPLPQIFIFPGDAEKRLISQETIEQNNCDGTAEMSQEIGRSHTVLYTLELGSGIKVEADGRAKIPEIGEVGVGTEVAASYQVGYGRSETVSRAQTVAAAPNSHIQHTLQQFEIWETGEVLIVVGEINQRFPYSFRRDFSIDAVAPANIGCSGGAVAAPLDPVSEPEPSLITETNPCATILYENLEDLRKISSVSDALSQAEDFTNHRQNNYREGDTIPANVLIATDLQSANLSQFPVTPINNQGGWGLFLSTSKFTAPNDGTYWCLTETQASPDNSNNTNLTKSPLVINGVTYQFPDDGTNIHCVASEKTGNTSQGSLYSLNVPTGWVIVWDSWKAYWSDDQYENDGLLSIYGDWEGDITIVNGEYCAVPIEWAEYAINDRRSASPKPNRQEFILGDTP